MSNLKQGKEHDASIYVINALKSLKKGSPKVLKEYIFENYCTSLDMLSHIPAAIRKGLAFGAFKREGKALVLNPNMVLAIRNPPNYYQFDRPKYYVRNPRTPEKRKHKRIRTNSSKRHKQGRK